MKIERTTIPIQSFIYGFSLSADYSECYQASTDNKSVTLELCLSSFSFQPKWVDFLYKLRNILVKPFGLKTSTDEITNINPQKGEKLSFFDVLERSETEILMYANDKHLEGWFSLQYEPDRNKQNVRLTTVVTFHNLMGRIYFYTIKPFHYLIVRDLLSRMCKY